MFTMHFVAVILGVLVALSAGQQSIEELKKLGQDLGSRVQFIGGEPKQGLGSARRTAGQKCHDRPWWLDWKGSPARWTNLNKLPVCFGAKGSEYGSFVYGQNAFVWAFKVVYVKGKLTCNKKDYSKFGCADKSPNLGVFITDVYNRIQAPLGVNKPWYTMNGYLSNSPSLVFSSGSSPYGIHSSTQLRIWYGEDLYDSTEGDNGGYTCVDIYGLI